MWGRRAWSGGGRGVVDPGRGVGGGVEGPGRGRGRGGVNLSNGARGCYHVNLSKKVARRGRRSSGGGGGS